MSDSNVCRRCGTAVSGSRCLRCGGVAVASSNKQENPRPDNQRGKRHTAQSEKSRDPEPSRTFEPQPSSKTIEEAPQPDIRPKRTPAKDPSKMSTAERIEDTKHRIDQAERHINGLRKALGSELGTLRADVKNSQALIKQRTLKEIFALEATRANAIAMHEKQTEKADSDLDREDAARRSQMANRVKQTALRLRDVAQGLKAQRASIATNSMINENLVESTQVRELVSVGTLRTPSATTLDRDLPRIPALVPFVDAGHIILETQSGSTDALDPEFRGLVTSLVAQAFASAPPGQLVVTIFNPRSSKVLAGFRPSGAETAGILHVLQPTHTAFEKSLEDHLAFIQRAESSIGTYSSLGELVRNTGQHEHQYHVLVILDGPTDWSSKSLGLLEKIMASGSKAGLSVLLHRNPQIAAPDRTDPTNLDNYASVLRRSRSGWNLTLPGISSQTLPLQPADEVSLNAQSNLMDLVVAQAKDGSLPSIPFADLVSRTAETTEHGMTIRMGKKGTQSTEFILGDTVSNIQNVLVGGRAGSGKTNLLKVMIFSLAAQYPREELELFLLDFKEGGDFIPFIGGEGVGALPNVTVVSRDCDAAFGIETLRHFAKEMSRRANLTSDNSVSNIWDLRARTGQKLPRWVLIVDEFQGLFGGSTYQEATELLEDFVRKGRSFGLHVILATQTLSGVTMHSDKGNAIFENISARVVLQLGPGEFTKFMESGNDEGDQLRYRGQAIFNPMGGRKSENQLFVVARADAAHTSQLQDELHQEYVDATGVEKHEPFVYYGDATISAAQLIEENGKPTHEDGDLPAWYGRVNSINPPVASAHLSPVVGSHLLLLGGDEKTMPAAIATLQTAVMSAVVAEDQDINVILFEALIRKHYRGSLIDEWVDSIVALGANVMRFGQDSSEEFIQAVEKASAARERTVVALLGAENTDLHSVATEGARWANLLRDLPRRNVNLIGHWTDLRDIPGNAYELKNDYKTMLFFGKNEQLINEACKRPRHEIPPLTNNKTIVFSSSFAQEGLTTVTSLRQLTSDDLDCFRKLAHRPAGVLRTVLAVVPSATPNTPNHVGLKMATQPEPNILVKESSAIPVVPPQAFSDLIAKSQSSAVVDAHAVVGNDEDGAVSVKLGTTGTANLLVASKPTMGVPDVVERLIHGFAAQHSPVELKMDLIDSDESEAFPDLIEGSLPHLSSPTLSRNEYDIGAVLKTYRTESFRRGIAFKDASTEGYAEFRATGQPLARWILFWNAFPEVLTPQLAAEIERLVEEGPKVGIHLVLSGTTPVAERATELPNFFSNSGRLLLHLNEEESRALLNERTGATIERKTQGLIKQNDGPTRIFSLPTVDDGDLRILRNKLGNNQ